MNNEDKFRTWFRECLSQRRPARFDFSDGTFTIYINNLDIYSNTIIKCVCNNQLDFGC